MPDVRTTSDLPNSYDPERDFRIWIRQAKAAAGISSKDLAKALGEKESNISRYLSSHRAMPPAIRNWLARRFGTGPASAVSAEPSAAADAPADVLAEAVRRLTPAHRAVATVYVLGLLSGQMEAAAPGAFRAAEKAAEFLVEELRLAEEARREPQEGGR